MIKNYFVNIENKIKSVGFSIVSHDFERPWGGFFGYFWFKI